MSQKRCATDEIDLSLTSPKKKKNKTENYCHLCLALKIENPCKNDSTYMLCQKHFDNPVIQFPNNQIFRITLNDDNKDPLWDHLNKLNRSKPFTSFYGYLDDLQKNCRIVCGAHYTGEKYLLFEEPLDDIPPFLQPVNGNILLEYLKNRRKIVVKFLSNTFSLLRPTTSSSVLGVSSFLRNYQSTKTLKERWKTLNESIQNIIQETKSTELNEMKEDLMKHLSEIIKKEEFIWYDYFDEKDNMWFSLPPQTCLSLQNAEKENNFTFREYKYNDGYWIDVKNNRKIRKIFKSDDLKYLWIYPQENKIVNPELSSFCENCFLSPKSQDNIIIVNDHKFKVCMSSDEMSTFNILTNMKKDLARVCLGENKKYQTQLFSKSDLEICQPNNHSLSLLIRYIHYSLPGYKGFPTIMMDFAYELHHNLASKRFFLPDTPEGRQVLDLFIRGWKKNLLFSDDYSSNLISMEVNPDQNYLQKVTEEFRKKGIY